MPFARTRLRAPVHSVETAMCRNEALSTRRFNSRTFGLAWPSGSLRTKPLARYLSHSAFNACSALAVAHRSMMCNPFSQILFISFWFYLKNLIIGICTFVVFFAWMSCCTFSNFSKNSHCQKAGENTQSWPKTTQLHTQALRSKTVKI